MPTIDRRTLMTTSVAALAAPAAPSVAASAPTVATVVFHRANDAVILADLTAMETALAQARACLIEANALKDMPRYKMLFDMWCHLEHVRDLDRLRVAPAVEEQWDEALPIIVDPNRPEAAGT
jgi:hypothetical protein